MLYNMQSFVEPILAKVLTHCPETLAAVGGGGAKHPINTSFELVGSTIKFTTGGDL